jgi:hypothetical protein
LRPLHLLLAEPIRLLDSTLQFLLDAECDLERHWTHCLHQQFANGLIDARPEYPLTQRLGMLDPITLAQIFRP